MKEIKKTVRIRAVVKALKAGKEAPGAATKEQITFAKEVLAADEYVKNFIKENGTKAFLTERLRDHYIGEIVKSGNTVNIQAVRGKPYGTVVAVPNGKGDIVCGLTYMSTEDINSPFPILGVAKALKRALEGRDAGKTRAEISSSREKAKAQIQHFENRALAYFYPEKYSYTKGSEPINTYDAELQKRRLMIMGDEAYNASMCKPRTAEELAKVRAGSADFTPGN